MSEQITGLVTAFLSFCFRNHGAFICPSLLTCVFGFQELSNGLGLIQSNF